MLKAYNGSCHCGRVRFEADIDLTAGTGKCNCSICRKKRSWAVLLKPDQFRLLSGSEDLSDYQFGSMKGHHRFCRFCGVGPFSDGTVEELGGAFVSVQLACLDDAPESDLAEAPVDFGNGRDDLWWERPRETRHL